MKWHRVMEHDARINGVLRKAYDAWGWTPVEDHTPLDDLMDAEAEFDAEADAPEGEWAWPSNDQPDLHLQSLKAEEAAQVAAWARAQLVRWLVGGGVHPFRIVQRFYALCFARYGDVIGPLNGTHLGEILGQGRAAFSATMRELFGKPVEAKLGMPLKVAGQKSAASKEKYAANATRHKPRQQLDTSDMDEAAESSLRQTDKAEAERRLAEARAAHERREIERDAAAHAAMTAKIANSTRDIPQRDIPAKPSKPRRRRHQHHR